ncbi:EamA family transporter [Treponema zioleckii]|uniref:EamA family transporter n=1 Tax=Treponema zioleckii TaxID=331680 RepID=UPI0030EC9D06
MLWILLVLAYGLLKGFREIAKKKAMIKNTVMEVLVAYTALSFVFVLPQAPKATGLESRFYFYIALKSLAVFLAWICSFHSLKKLPVSVFGILDLSRVLFATAFGLFLLGETLNLTQFAGLATVCAGLLLLKFRLPFFDKIFHKNKIDKKDSDDSTDSKNSEIAHPQTESIGTIYVILALASCLLNAISGYMDKVLMRDITSSQLQFWYTLFMMGYYALYVLFTRTKIGLSVWKNKWIWLLAIMFIIGDKALFIANGIPESRITVMTLIKQSGCLVTILGGHFIFKEKDTAYRLFCATIIILGILIGLL